MADVLRLTFVALVAVKTVDVRFDHGDVAAVVWAVACGAAAVNRAGFVALSAVAFTAWATADETMQSTHVILIATVAGILAVGDPAVRLLLLRSQIAALYLFACVNKINKTFISGHDIAVRTDAIPVMPAAMAAVILEGWLAWAVWRRHRWALPVAVALHGGIVAFMGTDGYQWAVLGSYNGMVVLTVWAIVYGNREPSPSTAAA